MAKELKKSKCIKNLFKKFSQRFLIATLAVSLVASPTTLNVKAEGNSITKAPVSITKSNGWLEEAYVEWSPVTNANGYNVYYKQSNAPDSDYKKIDAPLVRQYSNHLRADILGLSAGSYVAKVVPLINSNEATPLATTTQALQVKSYTREGFAFSDKSPMKTGSGGYKDDGTVPNNAQILYITADNVNTVKLDVITSTKGKTTACTGLVSILAARQKGIDQNPLIIRMIGEIKASDITGLNASGYIQLKGCYNVTFEGVGDDATIYQWGLLVRSAHNVEIRNLGIMLFKDDGISLDTDNVNIWVHNNDIFYGNPGSDADQVKGDGSCDVKANSSYVTVSYNHFWDSGKSSLCGMSDTQNFYVSYHHNWFDHSDSRHPRVRVGTIHVYNNYYDGVSKYGVGATKGSSLFVEANYYRNCKYPMLISKQGTDVFYDPEGTFSGEAGGMIKAYNNKVEGEKRLVYANQDPTNFDAYLATSRNETVPNTIKTLNGGNTYNNFDTDSSIMYSYTPDTPENVKNIVTTYAGRINGGNFKWTFTDADDASDEVNTALKQKILSYNPEQPKTPGQVHQPAPSAPTGLTTTKGDAQVILTWTEASGAISYNVKRTTTPGSLYIVVKSDLTSTSYTDTGLSNGTKYYYVVSAVNSGGESSNSDEVNATPAPAIALPAAPDKLLAAPGNTKVTLSWATSSGADSYTLKRSAISGGPYTIVKENLTSTLFDDAGLTNGTKYYYVVSAVNSAGESINSQEVNATPYLAPDIKIPDWKTIFSNPPQWFGSTEGVSLADAIIAQQLPDGGWKKDFSITTGDWASSTIDNDGTTSEITLLAKVYNQTQNAKYLNSCLKGVNLLLNNQYTNGGWPQIFNEKKKTYHSHITFNDNAFIHVMNILTDISNKRGDFAFADQTLVSKAQAAVDKGIDCILKTQIISNGVKTAWCQQHDEVTLAPTNGRAYELASITASESTGIVNYLVSLNSSRTDIQESIKSAIAWMTKVQIHGIRIDESDKNDRVVVEDTAAPPIWARFYELKTEKPLFVDRDGSIHYKMSELSQERRVGYRWYGYWPASFITNKLPAPTGLTAIAGDTQVNLNWIQIPEATSYNVKRSTTSGSLYATIKTGIDSTSYTDTNVTNETKYYYVVSATNPAGESSNSNEVNATPVAEKSSACDITNWLIPENPDVNDLIATKTVGNATTNLKINVTVSPNATWKLYSDQACTNELVDKIMNLSVGNNTVYVKVKAQNGTDTKLYSLIVSRKVAPSTVNSLSSLSVNPGTLTPSFDSSITSYKVNVGSAVDSIKLTLAAADNSASVRLTTLTTSSAIALINGTTSSAIGLKSGENPITIEVKAQSGTINTYTLVVNRASSAINVTGVSLDCVNKTMLLNDTFKLNATVKPSNATNSALTWSSSNPSVASVDNAGIVTAKAIGTAVITVKTSDGGYMATCTITVNAYIDTKDSDISSNGDKDIPSVISSQGTNTSLVSVTGITFDSNEKALNIGDTLQLNVSITPINATNKTIKWMSSDEKIIKVDNNGKVAAAGEGTAIITAATLDGNFSASCKISVSAKKTDKKVEQKTPILTFVGIEHSPLIEGDTETFYLTSINRSRVQYRMFLSSNETGNTDEITNGYTSIVDGNMPYKLSVDKKFELGSYKLITWVRGEDSKEEYDSTYTAYLNCVNKDDANRVYANGEMNILKDTYKLGETVKVDGVKGLSGIEGPYKYKLHVYNATTDEWLKNVTSYGDNIEWKPSEPGVYVLDVHIDTPNSTTWTNYLNNPNSEDVYGTYEAWKLKVIKVNP